MDLIIRNARFLGDEGSLHDLAVTDGEIVDPPHSTLDLSGARIIEADGNLLLPSFVEPHVHLDKVLLASQLDESSTIAEARERVREAKKHFTKESVARRVEQVIPWALKAGYCGIRTHVDIDEFVRSTSIEAMLTIREKYAAEIDIQLVAFPQEGLYGDYGSLELLERALDLGADCVGGLPEAERSPEDSTRHLKSVVKMAKDSRKDLDVHCDVLPSSRSIEEYLRSLNREHFVGRATADHLIALSYYDDQEASRIISLMKNADMNVISNPCTSMNSGHSQLPPLGRGLTRVKELVRSGVRVAFGLDNVEDPYNPFGDFDALSNAWLFAYLSQLGSPKDFLELLRMPTYVSAEILGLGRYGLSPGNIANFNILGERSARDALRTHKKPLYVIRKGNLASENLVES